jgi:hypothetical protein
MKKLLIVLLFVPLVVSCTKDGESLIDPIIERWEKVNGKRVQVQPDFNQLSPDLQQLI